MLYDARTTISVLCAQRQKTLICKCPHLLCVVLCTSWSYELTTGEGQAKSKACNDAQKVLIVLFPFGDQDQSLNAIDAISMCSFSPSKPEATYRSKTVECLKLINLHFQSWIVSSRQQPELVTGIASNLHQCKEA